MRIADSPRSLAAALLTVALVALVFVPMPSAHSVSGKRAVLRFSMVAGAKTGAATPKEHTAKTKSDRPGYYWDIKGKPGADVRPAFYSQDGPVTLSVADGGPIGKAGRYAVVTVKVSGVVVGSVRFGHLESIRTGAKKPGDSIGRLPPARRYKNGGVGWAYDSVNWRVTTASGIHTHMVVEHGCYRSLGTNVSRGATEPLAMLASGFPRRNVAPCSYSEMKAVNDAPSASPSRATVTIDEPTRFGDSKWWKRKTGSTAGYGNDYWLTLSAGNKYDHSIVYARWRTSSKLKGKYEVRCFVPKKDAVAHALYRVETTTGMKTAPRYQKDLSGWTSLGTYSFDGTIPGEVRLGDHTGYNDYNKYIGFDACQWIPR